MQPGAELIVEEYLDLVENWCVQFCVEAIGAPRLLGATEQLISATGAYGGSRVGGTVLPAAAAELCQAVAERARELGFIGYCGIDTGLTSSGELRVFDLNFRINASTPPLLVLNALAASRGPSWEGRGRWQTYRFDGSLSRLGRAARRPSIRMARSSRSRATTRPTPPTARACRSCPRS